MKSLFYSKTLVALTVAMVAAAGSISRAQDQPAPPAAGDSALPPDIDPNTPLAQVVKLAQSGVDISVIKNYIATSPGAFNLDADKIITLKDAGVPTEAVNAMLDRDKALYAANVTPAPPLASAPAPASAPPDSGPDTAPPDAPVTVNYFDTSLTPYGSWVNVDGYGRCWRPTTVIYDAGWRPYCDRGHWVYTDCGWYWDSDYAWGVTFHYGRWFRHDRFGWCWYPDTQWAPSWVTWRSSSDYCGWAPLPPLAVFRPGAGFFYRGASVGVNFDFGLRADYFTFVSPDHFCEPHPRRFAVAPTQVVQVYGRTTVINNFNVHDRFVVNNGIDVSRVRGRDNHPIEAVHVGSLPHADRQGWRGPTDHPVQHGNNPPNHAMGGNSVGNGQLNHDAGGHDDRNNNAANHLGAGNGGQPQNVNHQVGSPYVIPRQQTQQGQGNANAGNQNHNNNGNHGNQHDQGMNNGANASTAGVAGTTGTGHANNNAGNNNGAGQHPPAGSLVLSGSGQTTTPAQNHTQFNGINNNNGGAAASQAHVSTGVTAQPVQQQSQQQIHQQQFNAGGAATHASSTEQWSQTHTVSPQPAIQHPAPMVHPVQQVQQMQQEQPRQYAAPSQPVMVERSQPHVEVERSQPVQHSAPAASVPAQNESHDSDRGGSGNDKKNH